MVEICPFGGFRYNPDKIADLSAVVTPPYDVIDEAMRQRLLARHPANFVRVDFNPEANPYISAATQWQNWRKNGTMVQEARPAFYAYSQSWDGHTRRGVVGLLKAEPYETGQVLPHEFTLRGPKADRLELMQTTLANLSQIFMIYDDAERRLEALLFGNETGTGWKQAIDADGVVHRFRPVTSPDVLQSVQTLFADQKLLIADGHHRYETAVAFARQAREQLKAATGEDPSEGALASDYLMVFLTNLHDPGLLVYPTDRVLYRWPQGWDASRFETELFQRFERVETGADFDYQTANGARIGLKVKQAPATLPELLRDFDAALLEEVVFKGIFGQTGEALKADHTLGFYRDPAEVARLLDSGEAVAVFYMNAPSVGQVRKICEAGHRMPQKSTYFYPKILSGLVVYSYESPGLAGVQPLGSDLFAPA